MVLRTALDIPLSNGCSFTMPFLKITTFYQSDVGLVGVSSPRTPRSPPIQVQDQSDELAALGLPVGFGRQQDHQKQKQQKGHKQAPAGSKQRQRQQQHRLSSGTGGATAPQQGEHHETAAVAAAAAAAAAAATAGLTHHHQQQRTTEQHVPPPDTAAVMDTTPAAAATTPAAATAAAAAGSGAPPRWQQAWDASSGCYYYYNELQQVTQWNPPDEPYLPCVGVWAAAAADPQDQHGCSPSTAAPPAADSHEAAVADNLEAAAAAPLADPAALEVLGTAADVPLTAAVDPEAAAAAPSDLISAAILAGIASQPADVAAAAAAAAAHDLVRVASLAPIRTSSIAPRVSFDIPTLTAAAAAAAVPDDHAQPPDSSGWAPPHPLRQQGSWGGFVEVLAEPGQDSPTMIHHHQQQQLGLEVATGDAATHQCVLESPQHQQQQQLVLQAHQAVLAALSPRTNTPTSSPPAAPVPRSSSPFAAAAAAGPPGRGCSANISGNEYSERDTPHQQQQPAEQELHAVPIGASHHMLPSTGSTEAHPGGGAAAAAAGSCEAAHKPRIESTGCLPGGFPKPQGAHIRWNTTSSSSSLQGASSSDASSSSSSSGLPALALDGRASSGSSGSSSGSSGNDASKGCRATARGNDSCAAAAATGGGDSGKDRLAGHGQFSKQDRHHHTQNQPQQAWVAKGSHHHQQQQQQQHGKLHRHIKHDEDHHRRGRSPAAAAARALAGSSSQVECQRQLWQQSKGQRRAHTPPNTRSTTAAAGAAGAAGAAAAASSAGHRHGRRALTPPARMSAPGTADLSPSWRQQQPHTEAAAAAGQSGCKVHQPQWESLESGRWQQQQQRHTRRSDPGDCSWVRFDRQQQQQAHHQQQQQQQQPGSRPSTPTGATVTAAAEAIAAAAAAGSSAAAACAAAGAEAAAAAAGACTSTDSAVYVRKLLPRKMAKYWLQRYSLFSKFDLGAQMDVQGWYSVTPEVIASHQAELCACDVMVDAFAGCGGNAIQFAKTCKQVIAIEISEERLAMAQHNAKLYGLNHKIQFICGDFFDVAADLAADGVFLSPPWGGPLYQFSDTFDLHQPLEGLPVTTAQLLAISHDIVHRGQQWRQRRQQQQGTEEPAVQCVQQQQTIQVPERTAAATTAAAAVDLEDATSQQQQQQQQHKRQRMHEAAVAAGPKRVELVAKQQQQQQRIQRQLQALQVGTGSTCRPISNPRAGVVCFLPRNTDLQQLSQLAENCFGAQVGVSSAVPDIAADTAAAAAVGAAGAQIPDEGYMAQAAIRAGASPVAAPKTAAGAGDVIVQHADADVVSLEESPSLTAVDSFITACGSTELDRFYSVDRGDWDTPGCPQNHQAQEVNTAAAAADEDGRSQQATGVTGCQQDPNGTDTAAAAAAQIVAARSTVPQEGCAADLAGPCAAGDVEPGRFWRVERNILNDHFKGVTVYCGWSVVA